MKNGRWIVPPEELPAGWENLFIAESHPDVPPPEPPKRSHHKQTVERSVKTTQETVERVTVEQTIGRPPQKDFDRSRSVELRKSGMEYSAIAKQLGGSKSAVRRACVKADVVLVRHARESEAVPSAIISLADPATTDDLIQKAMALYGPYADTSDDDFDDKYAELERAAYRLTAEREAEDQVAVIMLDVATMEDVRSRLHAVLTRMRLLELELCDCAVRERKEDPVLADSIEDLLPQRDRDRLAKGRV